MEKKKVGFASGIGFILAAAGSAVGLGNLWGFPYKTSQNGGAAFVLIYIACVLLIGFVTMLSEIYLGRRSQANPMTAYKMVNKNLGWCGLVAIMIPAFIICYYSVLGGWTTKYALNSFSGNAGIVSTFSVNTGEVILYTALFLVLSVTIIMGGVKDGIEKASKVLMPVLFLILVAIAIYALTLGSGVREGLAFYLKPDFSDITFKSVLVAMGQAFYSLSLGMGIMITYGSYTGKEVNLVRSTAMVCVFDTVVALLAGLVSRRTPLKEDASFAGFYLGSLALGVTLVSLRGSNVDLLHLLFGSILAVDNDAALFVTGVCMFTLIVLAMFYRGLVTEAFDTAWLQVNARWLPGLLHGLFLALLVLNLVAGFQVLGTLMAVGLMMLPAVAARCWVRTLPALLLMAGISGIVCAWLGLSLSWAMSLPAGPSIVLTASALFFISILLGTRSRLAGSLRAYF